jgi:putative NIF3 family GTP cyclohydrolase 1 type 2
MNKIDLIRALNDFFDTANFDEGEFWQSLMSAEHLEGLQPYLAAGFAEGSWNGLMLDNVEEIERVYLAVFPTADVLDQILAREVERDGSGAMIFTHHMAAFEEGGSGFVQIPLEQLDQLAEHQISLYVCHAPLDCHEEISTCGALANALGLHDTQRFGQYVNGLAGIYGTVPVTSFQTFAERYMDACDFSSLRYDQILHNAQPVQHVAIVAGGGGTRDFLEEAKALGADTFVTGHWHLYAENDFAKKRRADFQKYIPRLKMNLLGSSHYGSEMVVMRDPLKTWFSEQFDDLDVLFIPQEDAWG